MSLRYSYGLTHVNDRVAAVQRVLLGLGIPGCRDAEESIGGNILVPILEDGVFGPLTESAVEIFQTTEGILADGIVGAQTFEALDDAWARHGAEQETIALVANDGFEGEDYAHSGPPMMRMTRVETNSKAHLDRLQQLCDDTKTEMGLRDAAASGEQAAEQALRARHAQAQIGSPHLILRADVAQRYTEISEIVCGLGGTMTCGASLRSLYARPSVGRSGTSMHYLGRAFDLDPASGMNNPRRDPFVVVPAWDREKGHQDGAFGAWTVYARVLETSADHGAIERQLNPVATYHSRCAPEGASTRTESVTGVFLDFTDLCAQKGFKPIRARPAFFRGGAWISAEWWHFQNEDGLHPYVSTFGGELQRLYWPAQLENSPVWASRDRVFRMNWEFQDRSKE